jgi:hypothetical protein
MRQQGSIYYQLYSNYLKNQGQKYTKKEKAKYKEKLKIQEKREAKREKNKLVIFNNLDKRTSYSKV